MKIPAPATSPTSPLHPPPPPDPLRPQGRRGKFRRRVDLAIYTWLLRLQAAKYRSEIPRLKWLLKDRCFDTVGIDAGRSITGHKGERDSARPQHLGDGIDRDAAQVHVE